VNTDADQAQVANLMAAIWPTRLEAGLYRLARFCWRLTADDDETSLRFRAGERFEAWALAAQRRRARRGWVGSHIRVPLPRWPWAVTMGWAFLFGVGTGHIWPGHDLAVGIIGGAIGLALHVPLSRIDARHLARRAAAELDEYEP
jgi:hypothetical protein